MKNYGFICFVVKFFRIKIVQLSDEIICVPAGDTAA